MSKRCLGKLGLNILSLKKKTAGRNLITVSLESQSLNQQQLMELNTSSELLRGSFSPPGREMRHKRGFFAEY